MDKKLSEIEIEMPSEEETGCIAAKSKTKWTNSLPCLKFTIAAGLSISSFVLGCTMIIVLPSSDPLIPFYSSLITGALAVWIDVPKYNGIEKNK